MNDKILIDFESQVDALIQQHTEELIMPEGRGTISSILERLNSLLPLMKDINNTGTVLVNKFLKNTDIDATPDLIEELLKIARPKIQAYIVNAYKGRIGGM